MMYYTTLYNLMDHPVHPTMLVFGVISFFC